MCGDHAAVAVKRRDPCTKRRGDLRLSPRWNRAGRPTMGPEASVTGIHARQFGHGLRQKRGEGERKKKSKGNPRQLLPPSYKAWGREIAVSNRYWVQRGPGVSVARYGRAVTAALAGVPRPLEF